MRINNITEFYNYIRSKDVLSSSSSLMQICACIDQFKNICSCKAKEKGQKLFDCTNQYVNTINNLDQNTTQLLLSITEDKNIEFYNDSNHIKTISV